MRKIILSNMLSYMNFNMNVYVKIIIAIFVHILCPLIGFCDDGLIWNYKKDEFLNYLKDDPKLIHERQQKLDGEIKKALDINLIPVNLEDCLTIALKNSSVLKIARSQYKESKWLYANSMTFLMPEVYYRYEIQDLTGAFLVGDVFFQRIHQQPVFSGFNFSYPIFEDPHKPFYAASKKNIMERLNYLANFTKEELLLKVTVQYYDLLEAKMDIEVLIINLRERQEQLRLMQARKDIGIGTKFDVLRAEAELALAKQQLITALNKLRLCQGELAFSMGIDVLNTVYPTETGVTPIQLVEKDYDIECMYKIALSLRQDIKAKEKEIKSLVYLKNSNYADFAPRVDLMYEYARVGTTQLGSLKGSHTWRLNAVVPMGKASGVGTMTQLKADEAKLYTAKLELRRLKGNVKKNILDAYYNSHSASEKIDASKKQVAAADEGMRFSMVGFDVGTNTYIDIINAQKTKTEARMELIHSTIEYNKAQAQMLFETGIISPETLLKDYKAPTILNQKYSHCD